MQVDPMQPTLKAPGTNRLTLKGDEPLSTFAFKFNSRRCSQEDLEEQLLASNGAWSWRTERRQGLTLVHVGAQHHHIRDTFTS